MTSTIQTLTAMTIAVFAWMPALAQAETRDFTFISQEVELSGVIDTPSQGAEALIIFVHGYGRTDVRGWDSFRDLRGHFNAMGITTVTWDKPGQGRSEGVFDINQPVEESAREVLDAVAHLRAAGIPGSHRIGLWGISRAGWIAPLAMAEDPQIDFWISVSGTSGEDNFRYLLLSNMPFEGYSNEEVDRVAEQWIDGWTLFRTGGSLEAFEAATPDLRANAYIQAQGGDWWNQIDYAQAQADLIASGDHPAYAEEAGQYIFVQDFDGLLSSLDIDVLALFGTRDLNIDWRSVHDLYGQTLGTNPDASLSIQVFDGADHNLNRTETGSLREMNTRPGVKVEGYYQVQTTWLRDVIFRTEE